MNPNSIIAELQRHTCKAGGPAAVENAVARGQAFAQVWREEREKIIPVWNAGSGTASIDSSLKRVAIMQETIRAFAIRMVALRKLATVFSAVPLQGTDEIEVPYYPLQTTASSTKNVADNGNPAYTFTQGTTTNSKKITVSTHKYQPMDYSSTTFQRQPWFNAVKLSTMNMERLAVDVLTDILGVVTVANFSTLAAKSIAAGNIQSDDIVDLETAANDAHWPSMGRLLFVSTTIDGALKKDPAYKLALNIGGSETIREGRLPNLSGFDYAFMANFPDNGEKLHGFAAFQSAILTAFCPVDPAPGVRQQLVSYDIVTDPETGISLNHRHWGVGMDDRDYEVVECNYGFAAGVPAALKRLTYP